MTILIMLSDAKLFISAKNTSYSIEFSKKRGNFSFKLKRDRDLVGFLTGHNPNGTHLVRIGMKSDLFTN